jgi:hypothetical protein
MIPFLRRISTRRTAVILAAFALTGAGAVLHADDVYTPQQAHAPSPVFEAPCPPMDGHAAPMWPDGAQYHDAAPFLPPRPRHAGWRVEIDAAPTFRDSNRDVTFLTLGPGGDPALTTSDWDYEFAAGSRSLIGRQIDPRHSVEFVWIAVQPWTDTAFARNDDPNTAGGVGNLFSRLSDFGDPADEGLDFVRVGSLSIVSDFETGELNLRQKVLMPPGPATVDMIYGARWSRIDEQVRFATNSPVSGSSNNVVVATDNKMAGFQLGIVMHYTCMPGLWVDFDLKGAILQNMAEQRTVYTTNASGIGAEFTGGREEDRTAFLGDLSLLVNVQLTPTLWLHLGYESIWLTGVALAAENIPNANTLRLGPNDLDHRGEITYHGPRIGLGAAW